MTLTKGNLTKFNNSLAPANNFASVFKTHGVPKKQPSEVDLDQVSVVSCKSYNPNSRKPDLISSHVDSASKRSHRTSFSIG